MKKTNKKYNKLKNNVAGLALFAALAFGLSMCTSQKAISDANLSEMYKSSDQFLEPQFEVFHVSEDSSAVYFKFNTKNVLYTKPLGGTTSLAKIKISYRLFQDYESNLLLDSGSVMLPIPGNNQTDKWVSGKFQIPAKRGKNYILRLNTTDVNRNQSAHAVKVVQKEQKKGRHEFLLLDSLQQPLFKNYVASNQQLNIKYSGAEAGTVIHGKFYNRVFPVAPPPFAPFTPKPFDYVSDSTFLIPLSDSGTFEFSPQKEGFYHFTTGETDRDGLTVFRFKDGFPEVNSLTEMVSAIRFITSKKEYQSIADSKDQKAAMDAFWLSASNNPERARELIKTYFNRVQNANIYFSSYKEGWKTDRGIIYMVFGPPNTVYKSNNSESWLYGEEGNYLSVAFNFSRVNNPFTPNDFILQRSPTYKTQWYRAVDSWRRGRVSTLDF